MFVRYFLELALPFQEVEEALTRSAEGWIPGLAKEATDRGEALLTEVGFGSTGRRVERQVRIELGRPTRLSDKTIVPFSWHATGLPGLFPVLEADLEVAGLGERRTQLALSGRYDPPLGPFGRAIDRALLHRVAEAAIKEFVERVAATVENLVRGEEVR